MSARENKSHFWLPAALTDREASNQNNYKVHSTRDDKARLELHHELPCKQITPAHRSSYFLYSDIKRCCDRKCLIGANAKALIKGKGQNLEE